ncbi:hypothetical protein F5887DRAFT_1012221 [Amanita rubescens]|nr:hypothetical protein F5887DRAFT_1012221 [Amanita rubescens]
MSSNPVWSFSFTTPDVDSSDEGEGLQECCNPKPDDHLLKDLDLSSREEAVKYTPNPFSIAKINAAARSRNVPSAMVTNLQGYDPVIQSEKYLVSQRQGDIREAFRRQAQRSLRSTKVDFRGSEPAAGVTDASTSPVFRVSGREFKSITDACPSQGNISITSEQLNLVDPDSLIEDTDNSIEFSAVIPESESTVAPAMHVATPAASKRNWRDVEAHICSDFSTGPDIHAEWQAVPRNDLYSEQVVTPPALCPLSSSVQEHPKRLTLRPSFVPPTTNTPGRKLGFSSPIFGRLPEPIPQQSRSPRKLAHAQSPAVRKHDYPDRTPLIRAAEVETRPISLLYAHIASFSAALCNAHGSWTLFLILSHPC